MRHISRFIVLIFVSVFISNYSIAQDSKQKKLRQQIKKSERYLEEVLKHLQNSSVYSEGISKEDFIKAGVKNLVKTLKQKGFEDITKEAKDYISESLSGKEYKSVKEFVEALGDIVEDIEGFEVKNVQILADEVVRGMLKRLGDPYSMLLTAEDIQKLIRMLTGEARDESLGFSIHPEPDGTYSVAYVMYGYAAYDAGLEVGDVILEINGDSVKGMDLKELAERLQVKPGDQIELKIKKKAYNKTYTYTIEQKVKKPRDVIYAVMPGKIGYLRLTIFDMNLAAETRKALSKFQKQKVKGIILDLRNNPGGALFAATATADLFIEDGKLITYTETKLKLEGIARLFGMREQQTIKANKKSEFEDIPLVVLTNHESASASELLGGALQDLGRAIVVGEKTYGKGVGQSAVPLFSMGLIPSRFLYITVMRYYLPTGRSIDGTGVVPDIEITTPKMSTEEFDTIWKLKENGDFQGYIEENWKDHKETLMKLAEFDSFDVNSYPNFKKWKNSLNIKSKISDDLLRKELRFQLRKYIERKEGTQFVYDLVDDVQLQRALKEILATIKE